MSWVNYHFNVTYANVVNLMFSLVDQKDQLILGNYISNFNPFVNHKLATYTTLCTGRQAGKASD